MADKKSKIETIIPISEISSWKDIVFPTLYLILIFILVFLIWTFLSPILAVALAGLVAYIHVLRDYISGKK